MQIVAEEANSDSIQLHKTDHISEASQWSVQIFLVSLYLTLPISTCVPSFVEFWNGHFQSVGDFIWNDPNVN